MARARTALEADALPERQVEKADREHLGDLRRRRVRDRPVLRMSNLAGPELVLLDRRVVEPLDDVLEEAQRRGADRVGRPLHLRAVRVELRGLLVRVLAFGAARQVRALLAVPERELLELPLDVLRQAQQHRAPVRALLELDLNALAVELQEAHKEVLVAREVQM